ncbi:MAG: hypothetical protein JWP22_3025 [Ramlibacter sp.]|nr:hypothetical protein [Ramlibacter sp.]
MKIAILLAITALGAAADTAAQPQVPAPGLAASAATPAARIDPGMIVRPPTQQVDPGIREPAPRNVDPGMVERPPADAPAASDENPHRSPPAPRARQQPTR